MGLPQELGLSHSIEEEVEYLTTRLTDIARIKTTIAGAYDSAHELEGALQQLAQSYSPKEIAEALIALVGKKPVGGHGDHDHWVIYQRGPERQGPLVTISRIGPHLNQNPDGHSHDNCIETLVALGVGLVSKTIENGEERFYDILPAFKGGVSPLKENDISVFNSSPELTARGFLEYCYKVEPLTAISILPGIYHSDFNEGDEDVYYVILRRELL